MPGVTVLVSDILGKSGLGSRCHILPSLALAAAHSNFTSGVPTSSLRGPLALFLLFSCDELGWGDVKTGDCSGEANSKLESEGLANGTVVSLGWH